MRVNHTGEVCAQALYAAQALVARDADVREQYAQAAREEEDHLAWTQSRLDELLAHVEQFHNVDMCGVYRDGRLVKGIVNPRAPIQEVPEPPLQLVA